MNTTITATITYPTADIDAFADANGYFEQIPDPSDESQTIANPESRVDFVKRLFLDRSVDWFTRSAETQIREQKRIEIEQAIEFKRDEIKNQITIT